MGASNNTRQREESIPTHVGSECRRVGPLADQSPELLEGEWDFTRTVLISFPTREDALAWFNSPEYQELAKHRKQASTGPIMLIPGFE